MISWPTGSSRSRSIPGTSCCVASPQGAYFVSMAQEKDAKSCAPDHVDMHARTDRSIRKGSDPASQRMGTLRPGALVFASETVTLVDGRVRVCIGESQWTTVKTLNKKSGEGKVLLVPISLKTAKGTVDASKLLSSSTALLKQTLAKTSGDNLDDALDDMNWQRDELETKIETVLAGAEGLLGGDALEIWRKTSSAIGRTREAISDDSSSANTTIVSTAGRAAEALKSGSCTLL